MDNNFQDRIDEYLLHGDSLSEKAKAQFLKEIEEDEEKREQYEFTKNVKQAMISRGEKLKAMTEFQKEMKHSNRKTWLWISSIAAVMVRLHFLLKLSHGFQLLSTAHHRLFNILRKLILLLFLSILFYLFQKLCLVFLRHGITMKQVFVYSVLKIIIVHIHLPFYEFK